MKKQIAWPAAIAGIAVLAASLTVTAASAAPAQPAAPRNVCRAWEEVLHTYPLEPRYRVAAECSSINPADKAAASWTSPGGLMCTPTGSPPQASSSTQSGRHRYSACGGRGWNTRRADPRLAHGRP